MSSSGPLLKLISVSKQYATPGGGAPLTVLNNISLEVGAGDSVAIVGPSGSGKSTLLQIIGTLDHASSGEVWLDQQKVSDANETKLAAMRNRQIGFVFQAHYLLPQCTVIENVLVPTLVKSKEPANTKESSSAKESKEARAARLLKRVGLGDRIHHKPAELSGGERQRTAVVRALINCPQLLLADEPTGSLDHTSAEELAKLLLELNKEEGVTLIVVTHARDLAQRMGRVLELENGRWKSHA